MAYRKKTIKQLRPTAKKLAKAIGELDGAVRKLKNILNEVNLNEVDVIRLTRALSHMTHEATIRDKAI